MRETHTEGQIKQMETVQYKPVDIVSYFSSSRVYSARAWPSVDNKMGSFLKNNFNNKLFTLHVVSYKPFSSNFD